ncbi:PREDICTED: protein AF-9-like, partial [Leptosomus discolor]|uniref:protein AF-9-like n=1 Tax=Leptosomus discolor TaxID=188344 RepID=UPI0005226ADA
CKDPPYKVEESGYAGFILPIEVYFKNKEEPKKVRFDYDLFLHLEGHPPVNHLRCEKLTFNNPTEEFRRKLLKAGGIMVMSDGTSFSSGQSLHLPNLPSNCLSFSEVKKKSSHGPKVVQEPMNRGALLDFLLTKKEGLFVDVKAGGSLSCSDHDMLGVQDPAWKKPDN